MPQFSDVCNVMTSVPGVDRNILLERDDAKFWMPELTFPVARFKGSQQLNPALM